MIEIYTSAIHMTQTHIKRFQATSVSVDPRPTTQSITARMSIISSLFSGLDTVTVLIFLLVLLVSYYWLTRPKNMPPGPTGLPVVGNLLKLREAVSRGETMIQMMKWRETYGDVFTIRFGNINVVVINDYKMLHDVFVKQGNVFSSRPDNLYILEQMCVATGTGILDSSGPMWKEMKRVILMTLRDVGVGKKSLEEKIQDEARAIVKVLEKGQDRRIESLKSLLSMFSSNIISSIIFGNRFDYDDPVFIQMIEMVNIIFSQPLLAAPVNFMPFLRFTSAGKRVINDIIGPMVTIDKFLAKLLKDREETYDATEVRDFVDLYMKTSSESEDAHLYNAHNMRRVIIDLFAAGTDTSATTVSWAILYWIAYPNIQTRCQQEVDKVLGERMPTVEDRKSMPYTEAFITELLRISTIAPLGVAHMAAQEAKIGEFTIPAKTVVISNQWAIHHDPNNWPQPSVFKPERFLDKDGNFCPPKENFVPFSIGPRTCLGDFLARIEIFILLTTLVRSFTFTMEDGQKPDLVGDVGIVNSPKDQNVWATPR